MSKRSASEYITKEHGSIPQDSASDKPQMASAAHMATRKTATPRGRLNRAGTPQRRFPPSANAGASNPFATIPQQTFGSVGNGVVFGAGSENNNNNNNAAQPGGFTFSANNISGANPFATTPNPFANINGTTNFGNQNTQNAEDESMDTGSPIKKRSRTENSTMFGGFGQNSSDATSKAPTFGGFGQSQTPSQPQNSTPFGGLFGAQTSASQSQTPAPTSNLFGSLSAASSQQTSAPTFAFGQTQNQTQSSSEQQSAKPAFVFGQQSTTTSTSAQQTPAPKTLFGFGQSTQSVPEQQPANSAFSFGSGLAATSQSTAVQTPKPTFSFGGAQAQPASEQQTPTFTNSLFGAQPPISMAAQDSPLVFGAQATSTSQSQAQTPKPTTTSLFGTSTQATSAGQSPAKPTFSFGKPVETVQEPQQPVTSASTNFLFGQPSTTAANTEQPKPQFTGFNFGQSQTTANAAEPPAVSSSSNKALFPGDHNASQAAPHSFGGSRAAGEDSDSSSAAGFSTPKTSSHTNMFGAQSEPPKKGSLFGQTPSSKPASDAAPATTGKPSFSFGQPAGSPSKEASTADETPKANPFANLFATGQTTSSAPAPSATATSLFGAPRQGNDAPTTSSTSFGSLPASSGGLFTPSPVKSAPSTDLDAKKDSATTAASTGTKKSLFGTLSQPAPVGLVEQATASAPPTPSAQVASEPKDLFSAAKPAATPARNTNVPTQRTVYTKSPSRMPKFLNAEGFMEYDKNYRLRALNKEFQKQIATIDADRSDFENLVRHYVAARSAIGGDMGLYQRTTAGTKRKSGEVDEETVPLQYKKSKVTEPSASHNATSRRGFTEITATTDPVAPKPTTPAKATSLLNNMIPAQDQATQQSNPGPTRSNPFAAVSYIPTAANDAAFQPNSSISNNVANAGSTPAAKKAGNFGQLSGSTTPMKSPPKNSFFGMSANERSGSKKRKASSDEEEDEVSSEDEGRKKRTKSSNGIAKNLFGASSSTQSAKTGTPLKTLNGPFISDEDEDETDGQTGDDAEDGDFAPNANESDDDDDSDAEDSQQVSEEELGQTPQEDSETSGAPEEDHTDEIKNNPNAGRSLFDRVEPPANKPESTTASKTNQTSGSRINWPAAPSGQTPETPSFSPLTPGSRSPYKPATTFNYTPTQAPKPAPTAGASVLAGGITSGKEYKFSGMFGSRPSTPDPEQANSKVAAPTSTPGDNTWKKGQEIKFNVTEPSPGKSGASTPSFNFGFGNSTTTPAPGFLNATPHLTFESGLSSVTSSRATSPGATDNESVATNDTNDEEGGQAEPQQDLMNSNPGEENEDVLYSGKAKALLIAKGERAKQLKVKENEWTSIGLGQLRLLKNRSTGRVRILLRSEPGANIVLNNYLESQVDYVVKEQTTTQKSGAVHGAIVRDGCLDTIVLKVKDGETAKTLAALMMKHRADGQ